MTDTVKSWIEERETIHGKATKGELIISSGGTVYADGEAVYWPLSRYKSDPVEVANIESFVDAHNTLPKLLAGVRAVLELHAPKHDGFTNNSYCGYCRDEGGDLMDWPCDEYKQLQEAINDE